MSFFRPLIALIIASVFCQSTLAQDEFSEQAVKNDLSVLHMTLQQAHYDLYAHRSREDYRALLNDLYGMIDGPQSVVDASKIFQRYVAFGKIGHAKTEAGYVQFIAHIGAGGRFLPIFIRVDGGTVFLVQAADIDGQTQAGMVIHAINGRSINSWLNQLGVYVSAERDLMRNSLMEESFAPLLWMELGEVDNVTLTVEGSDSVKRLIKVDAVDFPGYTAIRAAAPSKSLDTDFNGREYRLLSKGLAYLRPGPFIDLDTAEVDQRDPSYSGDGFFEFIDQAFEDMIASDATDLIIDLRNNPGGNNNFSDAMTAWFADKPFRFTNDFRLKASAATKADYERQLESGEPDGLLADLIEAEMAQPNGMRYSFDIPMVEPRQVHERYKGQVWAIVNRHSYSNATSTAAMIQDYEFGRVFGEETADLPTSYASVLTFELPETGVVVTYPKSRFLRPSGNVTMRGVIPDIVLPREPIESDKDVILEAVSNYVWALRD